MRDILIVSATRLSRDQFWEEAPLAQFLSLESVLADGHIHCWVSFCNCRSLGIIYNEALVTVSGRDKRPILLFVHDDVRIEDAFLYEKLNAAIERYAVVGLAGASQVKLTPPISWFSPTDRRSMSGAVAHPLYNGTTGLVDRRYTGMSSYGTMPKNCVVVDGLFMAVDAKKIVDEGIQFDPNLGFHFYDIDFCLEAHTRGLSVGTWPIWVYHQSVGASIVSQEWRDSQTKFLEKWPIDEVYHV